MYKLYDMVIEIKNATTEVKLNFYNPLYVFFNRRCASFPFSDPERLEKWISAVSRESDKGTQWRPTQYSRICSNHFIDDDYIEGTRIKALKSTTVPTRFVTYPLHKQPAVKKMGGARVVRERNREAERKD